MNGNRLVLDTNAVLYVLTGDETLADFLFEKELYISIITEMELLAYKHITAKEQAQIVAFIKELKVININNAVKTAAIEVKKASQMKLPDSIIAATAISLQLSLVTSDKQFKTLKGLDVIYYEK